MARRLTAFVHVAHPDTRQVHAFGPEDRVPRWAAALITNPAAWDGTEPAPKPDPVPPVTGPADGAPADAPAADATPPGTDADGDAADVPPVNPPADEAPKGNASTEVWAAYAVSVGVAVPSGASRDDIRALVEAASS